MSFRFENHHRPYGFFFPEITSQRVGFYKKSHKLENTVKQLQKWTRNKAPFQKFKVLVQNPTHEWRFNHNKKRFNCFQEEDKERFGEDQEEGFRCREMDEKGGLEFEKTT